MKKLIALLLLSVNIAAFGQTNIAIEVGLDQHVSGGGPFVGVAGNSKGFRFGCQLLTQINAFTPYTFEPYNDYRFAGKASQFFGGGVSFGYEFKHTRPQKVKPILMYRSGYFYSGFGKIGKYIEDDGSSNTYFLYSSASGFSCFQNVAAGITWSLGKNFVLDFTLGSGVYIFRERYFWTGTFSKEEQPAFGAKTVIRPDLNANLSLQYRFALKE